MLTKRKFWLVVCLLLFSVPWVSAQAQVSLKPKERCSLCRIERAIRKEARKLKHGTTYYNGPGSGYQVTHSPSLDSITNMVKRMACVENAVWDKCQTKCAIYPGHATLGVRIFAEDKMVEKCFHFQLGSTGVIKIFGWRPHLLKTKDILIYTGKKDCTGFIDRQSELCKGTVK